MVLLPDPGPAPKWFTTLAVDVMYFHMARQLRVRAARAPRQIERAERRLAAHQAKMDALNRRLADDEIDSATHYNRFEPLAIQMESYEYGVGTAYGLLLEHVGAIHMLCVATLEAHINIRGKEVLSNRQRKTFERLAVDAKWLYFPPLRGITGFDPGTEPFQGFDRLIKIRNGLAHYKPKREDWRGSAVPPRFLVGLGLTLEAADQSLVAAKSMVRELARQLGEREPWWLDSDASNFFGLETENPTHKK
jgi:hypothetical protein